MEKNQWYCSSENEWTTGVCTDTDQSQEYDFNGKKKQVIEEYIELCIFLHEVQKQSK